MITIDAGLRALLGSQHYTIYPRVKVARPTEARIDLTSRLVSGSITASIDDAARRFTLSFQAGSGATSLQPLITASTYNDPSPLLWSGSIVEIEVAIMPPGAIPGDGDYTLIEYGRIDRVDAATDPGVVKVSGRDWGTAHFLRAKVRESSQYGGDYLENVIAQIVYDWVGPGVWGAPPTALGPRLPGGVPTDADGAHWMLNVFPQDPGISVLELCQEKALQIGWDFRHFPRYLASEADQFAFALYDPGRTRTVADATISLSEYTHLRELSVNDDDVRNWWFVRYGKHSTREFVEVQDATSQSLYGVHWAEIHESQMSNIDTLEEATRLANYALADTKDPYASHAVTTRLWPFVELNDLHSYPANAVHYDTLQTMAVVGYTHTFDKGGGTTEILCRGTPIAAYRRWRIGRPLPVLVSTQDPPTGPNAREGTLWCKVADLSFPA